MTFIFIMELRLNGYMFIWDINMYKIFIYVIHILFSYMITRIKFVYIFYFEHLMFRIKYLCINIDVQEL